MDKKEALKKVQELGTELENLPDHFKIGINMFNYLNKND